MLPSLALDERRNLLQQHHITKTCLHIDYMYLNDMYMVLHVVI